MAVIAVSVSPRPWIEAKIQHGGGWKRSQPQEPNIVFYNNFLMTVRAVGWACEHINEMLQIQKKNYFRPDYSRTSLRYDRHKKYPTILYGVNLWLKPVSATGAMAARYHTVVFRFQVNTKHLYCCTLVQRCTNVIQMFCVRWVSIVGSLRDREVACSASDRQGSNFESCVWRTVSSQSSHHPQEVLLAQFSLYVHKGGLKPDSFYLCSLGCSLR